MSKARTDGEYVNPEVRFERTDVEVGTIVRATVWLAAVIFVSAGLTTWAAWYLTKRETPLKVSELPPAAVDETTVGGKQEVFTPVPPQPRLEALDDVREQGHKPFQIFPTRAPGYYEKQEQELKTGDKAADVLPIDEAIRGVAGRLPARKGAAPGNYGVELPSKASAARTTTGGQ